MRKTTAYQCRPDHGLGLSSSWISASLLQSPHQDPLMFRGPLGSHEAESSIHMCILELKSKDFQ